MIDREKVVRAVETCFDSWIDKHKNMGLDLHEVEQMKQDALELLKEREPVEPKWFDFEDAFSEQKYKIPICGACESLLGDAVYCLQCGRKVKWDD